MSDGFLTVIFIGMALLQMHLVPGNTGVPLVLTLTSLGIVISSYCCGRAHQEGLALVTDIMAGNYDRGGYP